MNQLVPLSMMDKIFAIEAEMKKLPQINIPVRHIFSPGVYAREITVPAGALITGVIHKYPQINILSKGTIRVSVEDEIKELSASHTVVSDPGVKRIAFALTEVVWTTIVHTHLTDVDEIEREFFAYSQDEYEAFLKMEHEKATCPA